MSLKIKKILIFARTARFSVHSCKRTGFLTFWHFEIVPFAYLNILWKWKINIQIQTADSLEWLVTTISAQYSKIYANICTHS